MNFTLNDFSADSVHVEVWENWDEEVQIKPEGFEGVGMMIDNGVVMISFVSDGKVWEFPLDKEEEE